MVRVVYRASFPGMAFQAEKYDNYPVVKGDDRNYASTNSAFGTLLTFLFCHKRIAEFGVCNKKRVG